MNNRLIGGTGHVRVDECVDKQELQKKKYNDEKDILSSSMTLELVGKDHQSKKLNSRDNNV